MSGKLKKGFSLMEVLIVVLLIGILSGLAYSSLNELIQTNRAKEVAREMTAFTERALAEAQMRKKPVSISIVNENTIQAIMEDETTLSKTLANSFFAKAIAPLPNGCGSDFNNSSIVTSQIRIGSSGINGSGCFVMCNSNNYCGSTVKTIEKNTFTAHIKKRNSNEWEAL
jgi:prepilin-type N-terminal cleavage/methylation domain-containing protein